MKNDFAAILCYIKGLTFLLTGCLLMLYQLFQVGSLPPIQIHGTYNYHLVLLSYLVAVIASYVALDIAGHLRDRNNTRLSTTLWLVGGAFAMGAGIWSMHFIGMLAFVMDAPMTYDITWTVFSMFVAILASGFTFFLLKSKKLTALQLGLGGVIMGFGIAAMHYTGMQAMTTCLVIHYLPTVFALSVVIAIIASEAALWLAIRSNQGTLKKRIRLKFASAFVMGAAICGMHYTGMAAAIFTPLSCSYSINSIDPQILSSGIAIVTLFILAVAFALSTQKEIMNYHTLRLAHQEGMAQVSASVLHNVGNVLNSINVTTSVIENRLSHSELSGLKDVSKALEEHKNDLGHFITTDPQGSQLPGYIKMLADYWQKEQKVMSESMKQLTHNIQHIKDVINLQQSMSAKSGLNQITSIHELLDEAVSISAIEKGDHGITVEKHYEKIQPFFVDKIKLMQILINLVRNGKHALIESSRQNKLLILKICISDQNRVLIQIIDNGVGIAPENMSRIFIHGFTTKKTGHGFGLHASAIAAKEMQGEIRVSSEGVGKGAAFTLELPYTL